MLAAPTNDHPKVGRIWTNAAWLSAMPLVMNAISILSAGFIARVLGTEAFGRFSVGSALVALSGIVTNLGLRSLAVRDLSRAGPGAHRALGDLLSLRLLLAIVATLLAGILGALVSTSSGLAPVILVTALSIIPGTLAGTLADGLMARDRAKAISSAVFWSGILLTVTSVIAAARWHSATALAAAYLVGPIVNLVMLAHFSRSGQGAIRLRWRPRNWRTLLHRAVPFFRLGLLSIVIGRLDTVVVGGLFGQATAGIFAAATSLADRLYVLIDSVASSILPTLARLRNEPARLELVLARVMFPLLAILSAGAIAAVAGATAAVTVVFGAAYASGGPVLAISLLLLPALALNALLSEAFLALRRDKYVVATGVRGQLCNLVLLPILSFLFGMAGARVAGVIGTAVSAVPRSIESRREFPELWSRDRVQRLALTVCWTLPLPIILTVGHFSPAWTVLIAFGGFLAWSAVTLRVYGGIPMLRDLLAQSTTIHEREIDSRVMK